MNLPNPQLAADAQALNVFAQAVSQAASKLANNTNKDDPEYAVLKAYFDDNTPKLKVILDRVEADLK